MSITKLPTDSFYKFITVLSLICIIYVSNSASKRFIEYRNELILFHQDSLQTFFQIDTLTSNKEILETKMKCNYPVNKKDSILMAYKISHLETKIQFLQNQIPLRQVAIQDNKYYLTITMRISFFLIIIGILALFWGFINWYYKQQITRDQEILKEHIKLGYISNYCHSCAAQIKKDAERPKEKTGEINFKYCTDCYQDGKFTEPNLTFEEMKTKVRNHYRIKFLSIWRIHSLKFKDRWKNL